MNRIATAAALAFTALAGHAAAAEYDVCASGCDFTTIQAAVDGTATWDVLFLEAETFAESVDINSPRVIYAAAGAELQGDGNGPALTVGFGADVDIEGLRISDGGGMAGVLNYGTLVLAGCDVRDHDANYGAILNAGDLQVVGNSVVQANVGEYFAGGINNAGTLQVSNSTIIGNQGYMGGGIANIDGTTIVTSSSLSGNHAESIGGAWSNHNTGGDVTFAASSSMSSNTSGSGNYSACYDIDGHSACTP